MSTKKVFQKAVSLLIVASMALSVSFTGCNTKKGSNTSEGSAASNNTKQGTVAKEPPGEVSIMTVDSSYLKKNYDQDLPVFKEIEKNLNIKLKWQLLPNAGYEDALNIKLSAGSGMPDVFVSWQQSAEVLAKNGAIIAMSDYFDTSMKNVKKAINEDSSLKIALTSPDGKVYFLPRKTQPVNMAWLIRQDWLDKLNLKVPDTTEEFYNVLKAFRDGDPNGNGKNDEIPLAMRYLNYTWLYLMQNWGLTIVEPWNWVGKDKNGGLYSYVTKPEFKDVISYINRLYKDKLLNQDILTVSTQSYAKIISENKVGVIYDGLSGSYLDKIKEANPGVNPKWTVMLPPKGPNGIRGVRTLSSIDAPTFISKNGNVKDATKFLDYIFADPEGQVLMTYGIKDKTYVEKNGVKEYTDLIMKNPEGLSVSDATASMGIRPGTLCGIQDKSIKQLEDIAYKDNPWIPGGYDLYNKQKLWDDPEPKYRFTTEEANAIKDIKNRLETYINENLAKMIVGNQQLDSFDSFIKSLKEKNIDQMVEIYQKVKDRTK